ncbi:hypothetical protein GXW75_25765, partial [Roseomonas oryzicola]|nr:hypothetical protein [Neoroseomonas oryzicola]
MPGWRWLGVFWAVVALGAAGTVWRLHQLGPPEAPAPAPGEAPAPQV